MEAIWVTIVVFLLIVTSHTKNSSDFVPIHEREGVTLGQSVPTGLHVKQNLNTEHLKAKLMDVMSNTSNIISGEAVKPAISVSTYSGEDNLNEPDTQSVIRFRSYDELKKDFQKINMNVKTDSEIINDIMAEIKQDNSSDERLAVLLEDLSYYLHQIDNAKIFSTNGFETLSRLLHHPSYEVKKASLRAISAATQGIPDVQVVALQNGVVDQLHSFLIANMDEQDSLEFTTLLSGGVSTLVLFNFSNIAIWFRAACTT
ncbi:unnamed protein product [Schistosoma spindalis]|nr:unnamed protein product [Schistosoma spindale]